MLNCFSEEFANLCYWEAIGLNKKLAETGLLADETSIQCVVAL